MIPRAWAVRRLEEGAELKEIEIEIVLRLNGIGVGSEFVIVAW